jgi:hypothetical protein
MNSAEELMKESAEGRWGDGSPDGLRVVMDDLLVCQCRPLPSEMIPIHKVEHEMEEDVPGNHARHIQRPCRLIYPPV